MCRTRDKRRYRLSRAAPCFGDVVQDVRVEESEAVGHQGYRQGDDCRQGIAVSLELHAGVDVDAGFPTGKAVEKQWRNIKENPYDQEHKESRDDDEYHVDRETAPRLHALGVTRRDAVRHLEGTGSESPCSGEYDARGVGHQLPRFALYPMPWSRAVTLSRRSPCTVISPSLAVPPTPHLTLRVLPRAARSS